MRITAGTWTMTWRTTWTRATLTMAREGGGEVLMAMNVLVGKKGIVVKLQGNASVRIGEGIGLYTPILARSVNGGHILYDLIVL